MASFSCVKKISFEYVYTDVIASGAEDGHHDLYCQHMNVRNLISGRIFSAQADCMGNCSYGQRRPHRRRLVLLRLLSPRLLYAVFCQDVCLRRPMVQTVQI